MVEAGPEQEIVPGVLKAVEEIARFAEVKLVEARPTSLAGDCLRLRVSEGRKGRIEYAELDALAVRCSA